MHLYAAPQQEYGTGEEEDQEEKEGEEGEEEEREEEKLLLTFTKY